ncbi:MAG TPA: GNAT family N-acetyltransferase [Polyangiales bacterium]|nr:GNAT family N-acetyltransferase [Polyangiales bacterium]
MQTERVRLRSWTEADREPYAALNADPAVMEHFPAPLTRQESDAQAARIEAHLTQHGFGFWALEVQGSFVGFVGLAHVPFEASFTPALEIGWRLARAAWGHGYASEAARLALAYAFEQLRVPRVVSYTATQNLRSRAVMERLGMRYLHDFDHPRLPEGHRVRRHALYAIENLAEPR